MIFEKSNILSKSSTFKRCLSEYQTLFDLLKLEIHFYSAVYYTVDSGNKLLGTVTKELLSNLSEDLLQSSTTLKEICDDKNQSVSCKCKLTQNMDVYLETIWDVFEANPEISEIPVVNERGILIAVIDKLKLIANVFSFDITPDKPINEWNPTKFYKPSLAGLNSYARNINSQHGEDGIIERIFSLIGLQSKYAVEFGGWDGIYLSNIRNLIISYNFSGLYIEGDPDKSDVCCRNYQNHPNVSCVTGFVGFDKQKKLDVFLEENNVPDNLDILSIDIDGYDYHVWDSLINYKPRVVIIEYNPSIPNDVLFINPFSENVFCGSSASAMVLLAHKKGYELVAVTETNCIFVLESEYEKIGLLDNSLEVLRHESRLNTGKYYQAYNKDIYFKGFPGFIWTGERFQTDKFQFFY